MRNRRCWLEGCCIQLTLYRWCNFFAPSPRRFTVSWIKSRIVHRAVQLWRSWHAAVLKRQKLLRVHHFYLSAAGLFWLAMAGCRLSFDCGCVSGNRRQVLVQDLRNSYFASLEIEILTLSVKVVPAWSRAAYLPSGVKSWPARPSKELCPQFLHGRAGPRPSQPPASKSAVPTRATLTRTNR